jgi:rhodanese-related sulfurtransferase
MSRASKLIPTIVALLVVSCGSEADAPLGVQVTTDSGLYREISIEELEPLLDDPSFTVVNTHVPFGGDIPGTDLSIPFDEIELNLSQLPDTDANIVLYCRSGAMSTIAAEKMTQLGYTNVFEVEGGMIAWEERGLSLDR